MSAMTDEGSRIEAQRVVSVAVPVSIDRELDYLVERDSSALGVGCRVLVPIGARALIGVVVGLKERAAVDEGHDGDTRPTQPTRSARRPESGRSDKEIKLRAILDVLDPVAAPTMQSDLIELCRFISEHYLAPIGEVVRAALPSALLGDDPRILRLTPAGQQYLQEATQLDAQGGLVLRRSGRTAKPDSHLLALCEALRDHQVAGRTAAVLAHRKAGLAQPYRTIARAIEAGLIERTDPPESLEKTEEWVRRTVRLRAPSDEPALGLLLGRSKKKRALLASLETHGEDFVALAELRAEFRDASKLVRELHEAGLVETEHRARRLDPFHGRQVQSSAPQVATRDQAKALVSLLPRLRASVFHSALLFGVTGSGKTEVYLQLIADARSRGGGAIVLVPEIALTPQLADRFRGRFGDDVTVLHSGLSPSRRAEAWEEIRAGKRPIVIGARSAVFAPVPRLAIIVVDEEHDGSFKQEDGVRYHARDVALVRARNAGLLVVMGSGTPSLDTYYRAREGMHELLELTERPLGRPMPEVELIDLSVHRPHAETLLCARLRDAIVETVAASQQVILFLNRRGFSPAVMCKSCGSMIQCADCSAPSMTYHMARNRLLCHLCGRIEALPSRCPTCQSQELSHGGAGTERVELALQQDLPGIRILRLDRDTSRGQRLVETLDRFRQGEADLLIGTQMLAKGHDFPQVTLVGILQGDHGLGMPDPRASERTFQLISQVAGRAGRADLPGRVMVQSWSVEHPALLAAAAHDYSMFATRELGMRKELGNPPFGSLALLRVSGANPAAVKSRITQLSDRLRVAIESARAELIDGHSLSLLGPAPAPLERVNGKTRYHALLRSTDRRQLRRILRWIRPRLGSEGSGEQMTMAIIDVDPQAML